MTASLAPVRPVPRAGITLLEVLISIGILAIGLGGVVALMPAAQSQATRAVVLDRAAALAANALADSATCGLLREGASVLSVAATSAAPVVVDPAAAQPYLLLAAGTAPLAQVSRAGVAVPAALPVASPFAAPVLRLFTELRDDLTLGDPPGPDDLPLNSVVDGARAYLGRLTCMLCVKPGASVAVPGTASVVVFHGRSIASPLAVAGTIDNLRITGSSLNPVDLDGRGMRDVVRAGVVLWDPVNLRFHQVAAAAYTSDSSGTTAYLTLQSGTALAVGTHTVQFLPDSVGFAERPYVPESTSGYTQ